MNDPDALLDVRQGVQQVAVDLLSIIDGVPSLMEAMNWRCRAADTFREALSEWREDLGRAAVGLDAWSEALERRSAALRLAAEPGHEGAAR
ncbi:hypothetical protein [Microbacterium sp. TNHR37B]|uniref:hypothetical protein n=1 Tax=Microbacterium sp. TNHR37B TaxID=1775956 RepID=UPI0007B1B3CA|nr:hypothetical protein [Microbacterium sp. TNHR37B]KZE89952.1 hypothetical protein AVP41_02754 [Microbacterium sp. TNHR37B]